MPSPQMRDIASQAAGCSSQEVCRAGEISTGGPLTLPSPPGETFE